MRSKLIMRSALIVIVLAGCTAPLMAQKAEVYFNAGRVWAQHNLGNGNGISSAGIYGMKAGVFMTPHAELEGSFGYMNHFEMSTPQNPTLPNGTFVQPTVHSFLYDVNGTVNFGERQFLSHRIAPYLSLGGGGLTAMIPDAALTFVEATPTRTRIMESGDTFLTVNYGGGVKFLNVVGPMGFRVDVRGRTLPNFLGRTTTWFEPTGGITFSWGQK